MKRRQDRLRRKRRKKLRQQGLKEPLGRTVRKRFKAVRYYRHWRERFSEREAALRAAQKHGVSTGTIRRWDRLHRKGGLEALLPKRPGPANEPFIISLQVQFLVVALRVLLGWNEKRLSAELAQRGLAQISHTAIGTIFKRYHLPTRTYHTKAKRVVCLKSCKFHVSLTDKCQFTQLLQYNRLAGSVGMEVREWFGKGQNAKSAE